MGIELERVKEIICEKDKKFNNFFLAPFNLYSKNKRYYKTINSESLEEIDADFAKHKAEIFYGHSCNLPGALGTVSIPVPSSTKKIGKQLKKMILFEKENGVFLPFERCKALFRVFLTFSLSFYKQTYPQSWKTIFVHLSEKSNLLVRSDNKTGLSSTKFLQTTTI